MKFIEDDPAKVFEDVIKSIQIATGKTLYAGQPEHVLAGWYAYREAILRIAINGITEQNFLKYATGESLDLLGELVGIERLAEQKSQAIFRVTASVNSDVPPLGLLLFDNYQFILTNDAEINLSAGDYVDLLAESAVGGEFANDIPSGTEFVFDGNATLSVINSEATYAGSDEETDDAFRERIKLAPSGFSVAGSRNSYRYHTMSYSSIIIDAAPISRGDDVWGLGILPGEVWIYIQTSQEVGSSFNDDVAAFLSDEKLRPIGDTVTVKAAVQNGITVDYTVKGLSGVDWTDVESAATEYFEELKSGLGNEFVISEFISKLQAVSNVHSVTVNAPASDISCNPYQVFDFTVQSLFE